MPETESRLSAPDLTLRRPARMLIVEDDPTMQTLWSYILDKVEHKINLRWTTSEEAAERIIGAPESSAERFDVIISDVYLAGSRNGVDLWKRIGANQAFFILTSVMDPDKMRRFVHEQTGQAQMPIYIQKPLNPSQCIEVITALLAFRN